VQHLKFESNLEENVPGGNTRTYTYSERNLKVVEYLGGEIVQRRHREKGLLNTL
jgi:hypothetical protein